MGVGGVGGEVRSGRDGVHDGGGQRARIDQEGGAAVPGVYQDEVACKGRRDSHTPGNGGGLGGRAGRSVARRPVVRCLLGGNGWLRLRWGGGGGTWSADPGDTSDFGGQHVVAVGRSSAHE